jgi:hypothetical protein
MTKTLANQYKDAVIRFEKANKAYLEADADHDAEKRQNEVRLAELIRHTEGSSHSEKKTNAMSSKTWEDMVIKQNYYYRQKNLTRAEKEGSEADLDRIRSTMSYEKTLIDKNLYQPTNPNQ